METLSGYLRCYPNMVLDYNAILVAVIGTCLILYVFIFIFKYLVYRMKIKNLEIAMVRFPNYADVRYKIAEVYYNYGDFKSAEKYYRESLEIYPFNSAVKIKLAMLVLEGKNDIDGAFEIFAQIRFAVDCEPRARFVIDRYLKEKKLYDKFQSKYGSRNPATA